MNGAHVLLVILLVVNAAQASTAVVAFAHGGVRGRRREGTCEQGPAHGPAA